MKEEKSRLFIWILKSFIIFSTFSIWTSEKDKWIWVKGTKNQEKMPIQRSFYGAAENLEVNTTLQYMFIKITNSKMCTT